MRIAIDVSPIKDAGKIAHRVRGTGFYIKNLKESLLKYFPQNEYLFVDGIKKIPPNTDIVHFPYFEPFFLTLPFRKKYKTIVTVHDLTPLVFPDNFLSGVKGKIKWQTQKYLLKKTEAVIADSECSKRDIIKHAGIPSEKIHVVYLAAGEEYKKVESGKLLASLRSGKVESLRKKYDLPEKFILYVGDVTWNKNLPRLIGAVKKLGITLVMAGKALANDNYDKTNPWNQDLVKVQELIKNDKNIKCPGFIPTEDLVLLYNTAIVFVMPSLYEGFGLPILEAMSCGCPVLTTMKGSLQEVAGSAAFYVDPYNVDSIKNGIREVFDNSTLQKELSMKGLIRAEKFSWKKTAEETVKVYRHVI